MKIYGIAENCYVNGRFDAQNDNSANDPDLEPVVLIHRGLYKNIKQAKKKAAELSKAHKGQEIKKFYDNNNDAFVAVEMEMNK